MQNGRKLTAGSLGVWESRGKPPSVRAGRFIFLHNFINKSDDRQVC